MNPNVTSPRRRRAIQPVAHAEILARIRRLQAKSKAQRSECTELAKAIFPAHAGPMLNPSSPPLWLHAIVVISLLAAAYRFGGRQRDKDGRKAYSRPSKFIVGFAFLRAAWRLRGLTQSIRFFLGVCRKHVGSNAAHEIKKPPPSAC